MRKNWIITGGAGFIGSNFVRYCLKQEDVKIINIDKLTYAGNLDSLLDVADNSNYVFVQGDIADRCLIERLLNEYQPEAVIHFAAESHVDRSIDGPKDFIMTNIVGAFELLESVRFYWDNLTDHDKVNFRYLQVSTDEVYGSLGEKGYFTERTQYSPNSPYSASKAAADHLVRAYHHTYGLPTLTTNCSNNYGPYQFPEKLIPLVIGNALENKDIPIYGDGKNIRDWLYVTDHCRAIATVLKNGMPGNVYNVGGNTEKTNLEVVKSICTCLDALRPLANGQSYSEQITFVKDRPGHDLRYAIDTSKIREELGWEPLEKFETGIYKTIQWYLANLRWVRRVTDGSYRGERLGQLDRSNNND